MAAQRRRRAPGRDEATGKLFPELPDPPAAEQITELRALRHPVWTEQKAKLIARYLKLFTFVTKHGTYIDGFAGRQTELTTEGWAAQLVLNNEPKWLRRFYLCDQSPRQIAALEELKAEQPPPARGFKRDVEVVAGDFNVTVRGLLATKKLDVATFCLLDQRTFECKWSTVETLAQHDRGGDKKIELFYFLPIGWIDRAIHATTVHQAEIDTWWGRPDWRTLVDMQPHEKARAFQRKFQDLGYRHVQPFPIWDHSQGDRLMFYMILATDHPEAPKLMWRAYDRGVHDDAGWDQLNLALPRT
jgi:three-Cys-motif partner protein